MPFTGTYTQTHAQNKKDRQRKWWREWTCQILSALTAARSPNQRGAGRGQKLSEKPGDCRAEWASE